MEVNTPVLFLGFNRPDLAQQVLTRLQDCGVRRLYVSLDGPRSDSPTDWDQCRIMREIVDSIGWAEEKQLLIRDVNLGCGRAVSSAISWFFEHVERGIIVEDDCLPTPSFFQFCEEMLLRYAHDSNIWSVAGTSLIPGEVVPSKSHFFSKYSGIWGWATWRRAWDAYSYDLSCLTHSEWRQLVDQKSENAVERGYWNHILELMLKGDIDTWDFQVQFCSWRKESLHVTSSRNLVQNLGFRVDGTHTKEASVLGNRPVEENPPPYNDLSVEANESLDRIVFSEKLHASKELVEWLYGQSGLQGLSETAEQQKQYIQELEEHLEKRASII